MNIVVTGGAGFIGSTLIERLLRDKHRVVCIDNFDPYYDPNIKKKNIRDLQKNSLLTFVRGDIRKKSSLSSILKKYTPETIIHLAAKVGVRASILYPREYMETNLGATRYVLDSMVAHSIPNIIFASSSSVYGNSSNILFSERNICEPISPYGVSKYEAEKLIAQYKKKYNFHATILRFFTVYGPKGRPDMAPYLFVDRISKGKPITKFGTGESKRDYTYVDDIVDGIVRAIHKKYTFEIMNLGSGRPISLNRFIHLAEKLITKQAIIQESSIQPGELSLTHADIRRAKKLLGYKPKVKIEEGLHRLIRWYHTETK